MLNGTEPARINTIVLPSLAALLAHPEFQRGLAQADEAFLEEYEPAPLSEEVERNLSRHVTERSHVADRLCGYPSSYLYNLGFVMGMINKGLTYA